METALAAERLAAVTDTDPFQDRVNALVGELDLHPEITIDRLVKAAGFSYQTWRNMVTGKSRRSTTIERFEQALSDLVEHPHDVSEEPMHVVSTDEGLIEIDLDVTGDFGVQARAIVKGPVNNPKAVAEAAAAILREIRGSQGS